MRILLAWLINYLRQLCKIMLYRQMVLWRKVRRLPPFIALMQHSREAMARMPSTRVLTALPLIVSQTVSIHAVAAERVQKHNISLPIGCPKCPQSLRNPGSMFEFLVFDKQEVVLFYGFSACISSSLQMRLGSTRGALFRVSSVSACFSARQGSEEPRD